MTAPALATVAYGFDQRAIVRFGGLAVPPTGQVPSWLDLNDADLFRASEVQYDGGYITDAAAQMTWRGRAVFTARDFGTRKIHVPVTYDEGNSRGWSFSMAKRFLSQSADQFLTTDGVTGIRCRFHDHTATKLKTPQPPFLIDTTLEFLAAVPWAEDLSGAITTASFGVTGAGGGGAWSTENIAYEGHWFTEPVLSLSIPSSSAGITGIGFSNTTSQESIVWQPIGFTAAGGHNVTVDCERFRFTVDGTEVQPTVTGGTFPAIYPSVDPTNPTLTNVMQVWLRTDGTALSATATIQYSNRYEF